jgi:hypothetical protein
MPRLAIGALHSEPIGALRSEPIGAHIVHEQTGTPDTFYINDQEGGNLFLGSVTMSVSHLARSGELPDAPVPAALPS